MEQIDLKTLSLTELKALAYDSIAAIEQAQKNLAAVNQEITIRMNTPQSQLIKVQENGTLPDPELTKIVEHKQ